MYICLVYKHNRQGSHFFLAWVSNRWCVFGDTFHLSNLVKVWRLTSLLKSRYFFLSFSRSQKEVEETFPEWYKLWKWFVCDVTCLPKQTFDSWHFVCNLTQFGNIQVCESNKKQFKYIFKCPEVFLDININHGVNASDERRIWQS